MIYVDTKGKGETEIVSLLKMKGMEVTHQHIDSGDIFFNDEVLERKTINDLIKSVTTGDKHLWNQLETMKNTYKKYAVIIEGFSNSLYKDKQVSGIINSITMGWGIPFFPTTSIYETVELIKMLYEKSEHKSSIPPPAVYKEATVSKIQWSMLQCIRGIGTAKATQILNEVAFVDLCCGRIRRIKCLNEKLSDKVIRVFKE